MLLTRQLASSTACSPTVTPAALAGIRPGDVIVTVGAETVEDQTRLTRKLYETRVGEEIQLTVYRETELLEIRLKPTEDPRSRGG